MTQLDSGQPAFQALHGDHSRIRISKEEDRIKKKEENCDTPNVTIESKIFKNFEEEEQHQQDLKLRKIEDTNTRLQQQKRENEEAKEKAPIFLYKSSSKQQEATRKSTSPPPSSIASTENCQ